MYLHQGLVDNVVLLLQIRNRIPKLESCYTYKIIRDSIYKRIEWFNYYHTSTKIEWFNYCIKPNSIRKLRYQYITHLNKIEGSYIKGPKVDGNTWNWAAFMDT